MSRFWLTYKSRNRLVGVIILDSSHLMHAHLRAAVEGIDGGADFAEGHELDTATAELIPVKAIGRMLEHDGPLPHPSEDREHYKKVLCPKGFHTGHALSPNQNAEQPRL